uniref:Uncharacterized protein n=1 Tax=Candidatus Kentrum sp. TC TaxID=2126339 RepID=A0A450YQ67_9GAMM|nr:MAG: hypothetical protein BECKTC1821D_GA0114238_101721 [Candidatus Kentron sp. TC]
MEHSFQAFRDTSVASPPSAKSATPWRPSLGKISCGKHGSPVVAENLDGGSIHEEMQLYLPVVQWGKRSSAAAMGPEIRIEILPSERLMRAIRTIRICFFIVVLDQESDCAQTIRMGVSGAKRCISRVGRLRETPSCATSHTAPISLQYPNARRKIFQGHEVYHQPSG